ncbi:MAG: hypothetical protein AB1898_17000 [Acidobacteriota bacterium]
MIFRFTGLSLIVLAGIGNLLGICAQEPASEGVPAQASLADVRIIYVVPMRQNMDQLLTSELVKWGHYQVTINPRQADAFLSDNTLVSIQEWLKQEAGARRTSSRLRGTAFLIDVRSEKVIWSTSKKPSGSFLSGGDKSNRELAAEIVDQLREDLKKSGR